MLDAFLTRFSYSSELEPELGASDAGKALRDSDNDLIGPHLASWELCNLSLSTILSVREACQRGEVTAHDRHT